MNFFLTSLLPNISYETAEKAKRVILLSGQSPAIKSGLLSRVADICEEKGLLCKKYFSEYDYTLLTAIFVVSEKTMLADARVFSAYPEKALKTVDTDSLLRGGEEIPERIKRNILNASALKDEAARLENAVRPLLAERARIFDSFISDAKILNYILRFIQRNRLFQSENEGKCERALVSCVTPWGIHTLAETVALKSRTVIEIRDELGCVSQKLINGLSKAFNQCGKDTVKLVCPLDDSISEHLLIPSLSLAFFTSNRNHFYPYETAGSVSRSRFLKKAPSPRAGAILVDNAEKCDGMVDEAVFALFEAMQRSDDADEYFKSRLDDEKYEKAVNALVRQIVSPEDI